MELVQKFLADHAALLGAVICINIVLSCVSVVVKKLVSLGVVLPGIVLKGAAIVDKIVDVLSANVQHKDVPKV